MRKSFAGHGVFQRNGKGISLGGPTATLCSLVKAGMTDRTVVYEFGEFRLDPVARVFTRRDQAMALAPKSFDLLMLVVERRGRVVERAELIRALWPDTIVEEANLTFQVSAVRKALGEDGSKWMETVPKHGYRFTAPVRECRPEDVRDREERPPGELRLGPRGVDLER